METVLTQEHLSKSRTVSIYGRNWEIRVDSTPSFLKHYDSQQPEIILAAGLIIEGLLIMLFVALRRSNINAVRFAEKMSQKAENLRIIAEKESKIKSQFLANMSHEIRTPLNGLNGFTELLGQTKLDNEQKGYVATIKASNDSLLRIVNDILDLSKLESHEISITPVPTSLKDLVSELVKRYKPTAEQKDLCFKISHSINDLPCVETDAVRLKQVLGNLLSNSIKFTAAGSIELAIDVQHRTTDQAVIHFAVKDSGIGIDAHYIDKLFDRFTQEDSTITRSFGGTGLGLAISKSIIEILGGEIRVESDKNRGSTFHVTLPFKVLDNVKPLPEANLDTVPVLPEKALSLKILAVDDNEINLKLLVRTLEKLGVTDVTMALDGERAVEVALREDFDLILMDCQMPVMDGYTASKEIKRQLQGNAPRIIALTANALKEDAEKCLAAGMDDYIPKPLNTRVLKQKLKAIVDPDMLMAHG